MKAMLLPCALLCALLLTGCASPPPSSAGSPASVSAAQEAPVLWPWTEEPVKVQYDRLWMYSARGESEDPELLGALTAAVESLKVGAPSEVCVEDSMC